MQHWYLVYTKPRQEKIALEELENQDYIVYLPLINVEKIVRGTRTLAREPLFARYLFIRLDTLGTKSWAPIRSTKGVANLVSFGTNPVPVADDLVNAIEAGLQEAPVVLHHKQGELVIITSGPFRGIEAVFQTYDGDHRAVILLSLMGKDIRATQDLAQLKKI
jgi:transcriptional antiterminator RfaH